MRLIHGDFHIQQLLLLDDKRIALFDFDELAIANPLLDVANFCADLYTGDAKIGGTSGAKRAYSAPSFWPIPARALWQKRNWMLWLLPCPTIPLWKPISIFYAPAARNFLWRRCKPLVWI